MRRRYLVLLLLIYCLLLPAAAAAEPENKQKEKPPEPPPVTRHIFVVVIDGLQAGVLGSGRAPHIEGLAAAGVAVKQVEGVKPPTLAAAVASILTGTDPVTHRCVRGPEVPRVPTLQALMEKQGIATAFYDATGTLKGLTRGVSLPHAGQGSDEDTLEAFLEVMRNRQPYFSVLVLRGPREAFDKEGSEGKGYLAAVTKADEVVGRLFRFLYHQGTFEQSTFVIAGTAGNPILILKGLPFKAGALLPPATLVDAGPTLGYVTGVDLDKRTGLVLWNALATGPYHSELYLLEARVKDLSEAYLEAKQEIGALREERRLVEEEKARVANEKEASRRVVAERDARIRTLLWRIRALEAGLVLAVFLFGLGYIVEYRLLKKRFLLF